jgi:hypothetical protein
MMQKKSNETDWSTVPFKTMYLVYIKLYKHHECFQRTIFQDAHYQC